MPQTKSVVKAMRSSQRKRAVNRRTKKKYRTAIKKVRDALSEDDQKSARELLPEAYRQIDMAAKKHIIHKNKAARIKSRLAQAVEES